MSKKIEEKSIRIYTRIYDEELLREIETLVAQGRFESKSDLISKCVEYALPILAGTKGKPENKGYDTEHALRQQNSLLRELSVNAVMTLNLVSSLFGERLKTLENGKTSAEEMAQGEYEKLPEYYQERLDELMKIL